MEMVPPTLLNPPKNAGFHVSGGFGSGGARYEWKAKSDAHCIRAEANSPGTLVPT